MVVVLTTALMMFGAAILAALFALGNVVMEGGDPDQVVNVLDRLLAPLLQWATGAFRLIVAAAATSIGMNAALADPYASIILSGTTFRDRFKAARLEPSVASVSVAGSGTIASPLIPWNVHGAFVAGTLGIAVLEFAQYAVLLWITPIFLIAFGLQKFSRDELPPEQTAQATYGAEPTELPERRTSV